MFGLTILGRDIIPTSLVAAMILAGAVLVAFYVRHARRDPDAIIDLDLLNIPTFFASVVGGFLFRIGIGAIPFLLPLLLQIGFGLSPFESGSLTFVTAAGSLAMKFSASTAIRIWGFRRILVANAVISAAFLASYGLFTVQTPHWLILLALLAGGYFRSLEFTALNAIGYADISQARMSRATSFAGVAQQMSGAVGVAVAAASIESIRFALGDAQLAARDMTLSFGVVALITLFSTAIFVRLKPNAGADVSGQSIDAEAAAPAR
jgi:hypothetical protein